MNKKTILIRLFVFFALVSAGDVQAKEGQKSKSGKVTKKSAPNDSMWDEIAGAFASNYIKKHPDHFIPQMSHNVKTVMAMQNAIPPLINLDDDMVVLLIKYVTGKQGIEIDLEPYEFDHTTMLQELTNALNRQVDITNAETAELRQQLQDEGYVLKDYPMKEVEASQERRMATMTTGAEKENTQKSEENENESEDDE